MDKISEKLQVNGEEAPAGMRQIAQFVRDQKPDLTISSDTPIVTGDEARIESPIQLTLNFLGQQKKLQFKQVSLLFRRESARDWLVIPVKRWKLSEVRIPEGTIPDLSQ